MHISIRSLRQSADDIITHIPNFVRLKVQGTRRNIDRKHREEWWVFLFIRADLLNFFIEADPIWDGRFLLVDEDFLAKPQAVHILEVMILYLCTWIDWSETRWCVVKYSARRMIRSGVCGVASLVRMVKGDNNMGANYINGFDGLTESGRFYLCIVACSAAPPEAVLIKSKKTIASCVLVWKCDWTWSFI